MKTIFKIDDIIHEVEKHVPSKWRDSYVHIVPQYIESAKKDEDVSSWNTELLRNFLSNNYYNPVASIRMPQGYFREEEIAGIKNNWAQIAPILQEIAQHQEEPRFDLYIELEQLISSICDSIEYPGKDNQKKVRHNPLSAIHRMIASLQPNLLTPIVSQKDLFALCNLLENLTDCGIKFSGDYYQDSYLIQKLILDRSQKSWEDIPTYSWQIKEKLEFYMKYENLLNANRNIILTGAPGTGKTYLAKEIAKALGATEENGRLGFVQFHPSYDYTDFVEGLRPVKKDTDTIGFERMDGIFMAFCRKALADKDSKYVFIIDEINRGEVSKILGELFFSIDPGYRGKKGKVSTQYSNLWKQGDKPNFDDDGKFYIPENVYIIGTMNDIDRSVESMDFAMRRRFAFKEVTPEERQAMIDADEDLKGHAEEIKNCMTRLNTAIKATSLGSQYQVGPAYFLKLAHYLENGKLTPASWKQLWDNHIQGLLFEYFRGDPKQKDYIETLNAEYLGKSKEPKK